MPPVDRRLRQAEAVAPGWGHLHELLAGRPVLPGLGDGPGMGPGGPGPSPPSPDRPDLRLGKAVLGPAPAPNQVRHLGDGRSLGSQGVWAPALLPVAGGAETTESQG